MINFRFHIVSLVAIFLALALGVVIGAGVVDRGVVDTLNGRLDRVEAKSGRIQSENKELSSRNRQLGGVIGDLQPFAISGRLVGDEVSVVAVRGVDRDRTNALVSAAQQANAAIAGTLWLEDKWALTSDGDVKALQDALGSTTKNKAALRAEGWRQLAQRLAGAPADGAPADGAPADGAPADGAPTSGDLLTVLRQLGFLGFDAVGNATITDFPGRRAGIVLVVGTRGSVASDVVAVPAATALHGAGVPVVVANVWADVAKGPARAKALLPLRDSDLARTVSTVDDLDQPEGPTTVVLAMADLFLTPPTVGHYGYGPDAQTLPDLANA